MKAAPKRALGNLCLRSGLGRLNYTLYVQVWRNRARVLGSHLGSRRPGIRVLLTSSVSVPGWRLARGHSFTGPSLAVFF